MKIQTLDISKEQKKEIINSKIKHLLFYNQNTDANYIKSQLERIKMIPYYELQNNLDLLSFSMDDHDNSLY